MVITTSDGSGMPDWDVLEVILAICQKKKKNQPESTTQIWVVDAWSVWNSALVSKTSFRGETSGGVAKCRLFQGVIIGSQTNLAD